MQREVHALPWIPALHCTGALPLDKCLPATEAPPRGPAPAPQASLSAQAPLLCTTPPPCTLPMQPIGSMLVASTGEESAALRERQGLLREAGVQATLVESGIAGRLEPALALPAEGSALLVPEDLQINGECSLFCVCLCMCARTRYTVALHGTLCMWHYMVHCGRNGKSLACAGSLRPLCRPGMRLGCAACTLLPEAEVERRCTQAALGLCSSQPGKPLP